MKRVIAALVILACIAGVSALHIYKTISLTDRIKEETDKIADAYKNRDWERIREGIEKIDKEWEENHLWAYLTLSTKQIDEIEISIKQSKAFCEVEAEANFIGEFAMLCMLIDHLPKQETFSIGELL